MKDNKEMSEASSKITSSQTASSTKNDNNEKKDGSPAPKYTKKEIINEVASWSIIIGIAIILATFINDFIIMKAEIISGSMLDTLEVDDQYLGNRLAYVFGEPERGEIVFFKFPDNEDETFVKRVIGLPGEKLEIIDGKVYINDSTEPLDEPYLREKPRKEDFGPVVIPEDCYFMMGDNRNHSHDSRAWDTTYVKRDQLLAKAWIRIWPPFAIADHYDYEEEN